MFASKKRPVIFPQSEHARLAGTLAFFWGNESFDLPTVPFLSLVSGVTFHDRGYDYLDTAEIPDPDEQRWLMHQRRGADLHHSDPISDVIVKLHIKRLVSHRSTPDRLQYATEIDKKIDTRLSETTVDRSQLEWCDRITHFCDNLAFDFCFELPKSGVVDVCPRKDSFDTIAINYEIRDHGSVSVEPWPFSIPTISGFVVAYGAEGYPQNAEPLIVPFNVAPGF